MKHKTLEAFAKEYAKKQWGNLGHSGTRICQEDFLAGANHVLADVEILVEALKQIEDVCKSSMGLRVPTIIQITEQALATFDARYKNEVGK